MDIFNIQILVGKILDEKSFYVISHQNITRRKLAEEKALKLSLFDGLTSNSDALLIIEDFQKEIQKLKIPNENSKISFYLTISIGLMTMHPKKEINFLELIKRADKLLYKAKENGRNQVVCELE